MSADKPKVHEVVQLLIRHVQEGHPLALKDIQQRFGVQRACASDYLRRVKSFVPLIEEREGRVKVWRKKPGDTSAFAGLAGAAALAFACEALKELEGTPHFSALQALAHQARLSLPEGQQSAFDRLTRRFQVRDAQQSLHPNRPAVLQTILDAIEHQRVLRVSYRDRRGGVAPRNIEPWGLLLSGGRLWVVAGKREPKPAGNPRRIYDVDGIMSAEAMQRMRFPEPPAHQTDFVGAFRDALGIWFDHEEAAQPIHLRVRGHHRTALELRAIHPSQQMMDHGDGWADLFIRVVNSPDVTSFVLRMLPDVQVVAPTDLRDAVRRAAKAFLELDRSDPDR